MGRNLDLEGRCATEVEAARIVESDAEIELELGVEPRQDLRDEAVALRGVEDESQTFGFGFGEHLDVAAADEQEAGSAARRDHLEPCALALAEDRERRLVLAGEFHLHAPRALGVHRCAGLVEAEHHLDAEVRAHHQSYAALRIEIARDGDRDVGAELGSERQRAVEHRHQGEARLLLPDLGRGNRLTSAASRPPVRPRSKNTMRVRRRSKASGTGAPSSSSFAVPSGMTSLTTRRSRAIARSSTFELEQAIVEVVGAPTEGVFRRVLGSLNGLGSNEKSSV